MVIFWLVSCYDNMRLKVKFLEFFFINKVKDGFYKFVIDFI